MTGPGDDPFLQFCFGAVRDAGDDPGADPVCRAVASGRHSRRAQGAYGVDSPVRWHRDCAGDGGSGADVGAAGPGDGGWPGRRRDHRGVRGVGRRQAAALRLEASGSGAGGGGGNGRRGGDRACAAVRPRSGAGVGELSADGAVYSGGHQRGEPVRRSRRSGRGLCAVDPERGGDAGVSGPGVPGDADRGRDRREHFRFSSLQHPSGVGVHGGCGEPVSGVHDGGSDDFSDRAV